MIGLSIESLQLDLLETYSIAMCESTILKLAKLVADTLHEGYENIHEGFVKSSAVNTNETGFRIGGTNGWLWDSNLLFTQNRYFLHGWHFRHKVDSTGRLKYDQGMPY